jgi:hypothetical protein
MNADGEGRFEGTLPHAGDWVVAVESPDPPVRRSLARVSVAADPATGEAEVSVRLPDTALRGRVVDESGRGVRAIVNVLPDSGDDRPLQVTVEPGERFVVRGLPEGEVRLEAEAAEGYRSDVTLVHLKTGQQEQATLVVKRERTVEGRIQSADGVPIAGASILAFEDGMHSGTPAYITDPAGRFTLSVRPVAARICLSCCPIAWRSREGPLSTRPRRQTFEQWCCRR